MKTRLILLVLLLAGQLVYSQSKIKWCNPAHHNFNVIDGQAWTSEVNSDYDRLPARAEKTVRKPVWNLSQNSAGVKIRFRTNAGQIIVRYKVKGGMAMPHMPATGVSGVDLYAKDSDGKWIWCQGRYAFADTVKYNFSNITPNDSYHKLGREYHLYLPLYNSVEWLEIGIDEDKYFEALPIRAENPIVVYGTSIAQGACASRPGMAWTNILERKMDRPLINLAFSGNGRLEPELIDLLGEISAKVYILDCLPNLSLGDRYTPDEVYKRITNSVKALKQNTDTPILLVEHGGYGNSTSDKKLLERTNLLNQTMKEAFTDLKAEGINKLYLLTQNELGLDFEDFVDGVHPSDLGMMQYAEAYEKKLRKILNEASGSLSTTKPVTQAREPKMYNWEERHNAILENNKNNPPQICFFGNSITHYWGGKPEAKLQSGPKSWKEYLEDLNVQNHGFGWDRVENVLWRIYHGELDGFAAKQVVFMLGTNNLHLNTDEEIIEGLHLVVDAVKVRQPHARILFLGIYPRRDGEERVKTINHKIAQLAGLKNVDFVDIAYVLLNDNGKIDESLFRDGLHPNEKGYAKLGPLLRTQLTKE